MNPERQDQHEERRVKILAKLAAKRPKLPVSERQDRENGGIYIPRRKTSRAVLSPGRYSLGFSSQAAIGDAARKAIQNREEIMAQHGPVKVLWKDGKHV